MRERVGFIAAVERNEPRFAEICELFEISRAASQPNSSVRRRSNGGSGGA
jgi:hypothetical protein